MDALLGIVACLGGYLVCSILLLSWWAEGRPIRRLHRRAQREQA